MGLVIRGLKVKEFLGVESNLEMLEKYPDVKFIYTIDFSPIMHLTQFKTGYYDVEYVEGYLALSYSMYNDFRQEICKMIHGVEPEEIWDNIEKYKDSEFVEMINFADNEGSFDYVVAEKLYNEFQKYESKAKQTLSERLFTYYMVYMNLLKSVSNCKGVITYW